MSCNEVSAFIALAEIAYLDPLERSSSVEKDRERDAPVMSSRSAPIVFPIE